MKFKMYLWAVALCIIPTFAAWSGTVNIPQTGQTSCWDTSGKIISCAGTGQDGDLKSGIVWPSPRFTNPGGSTHISGDVVLDRLSLADFSQQNPSVV
ncbi:MAG: hypothetical protein HQK89_16215 [Nitrospirae bacterium]|nr:hypothetical protein [Nitrospirota bacterium]